MCGRTCSRPSPSLPAGRRPDAPALVLIVEPGGQPRINPDLVATTLELTPSTGTVVY